MKLQHGLIKLKVEYNILNFVLYGNRNFFGGNREICAIFASLKYFFMEYIHKDLKRANLHVYEKSQPNELGLCKLKLIEVKTRIH